MALFKRKKKKQEKPVQSDKVKKPVAKKKDKPEVKKPKALLKKKGVQIYQVIKEPHITEKAGILAEKNKYVFKVYSGANKIEIKKAVEALYGVKVEKVHIIHGAPKKRRLGRHQGWRQGLKKGFKKAIVTLVKGDKIELLPR